MLIDLKFSITFCPYDQYYQTFWTDALTQVEETHPGAVKWWNLQCYDGGGGNDPKNWADKITSRSTDGYILAGDWCRFYDPNFGAWRGDCPQDMQTKISGFSDETCFGGAFIWGMDLILAGQEGFPARGNGCNGPSPISIADYVNAVKQAKR